MSRKDRKFLGMLTPSSNTTLEPVTARILAGVPDVSAHFARLKVTEITLSERGLGQFDASNFLAAADLLADAKCHAIAWSGTSAGWLGFQRDRDICAAIERRTGIRACSSVLALDEIFRRTGVRRFGLVTPYTDDVQARIVENFRREGYECAAERHLGISVNFDFSEVEADAIERMIREVAQARPDAITVLCTNMDGATPAAALERETGVPVYDTIATAVWGSLRLAGVAPARVSGWGRLFREVS